MNKILVLIRKDWYFNRKAYIAIAIVVIVIMIFAIFGFDGNYSSNYYYLFYTYLLSVLFIPYSYYIEDNISTKRFISSLPVSTKEIIIAKYLFSIICAVLISSISLILFNALGETPVLCRLCIIPILTSLIFSEFFVFLAYRWDIQIASGAGAALVLFPEYLLLLIERKYGVDENIFTFSVLLLCVIVAIVTTWCALRLTVKTASR